MVTSNTQVVSYAADHLCYFGGSFTECTLSILNKSSATDLRMEIVMLCNLLFGGTASLIAL